MLLISLEDGREQQTSSGGVDKNLTKSMSGLSYSFQQSFMNSPKDHIGGELNGI